MSEMKGGIFSITIFIALIIPLFLTVSIGSIHQQAFMKVTTEMSELVREEGGVTEEVHRVVNELKKKGYTITFKNAYGSAVDGKQTFGDQVVIDYSYEFQDVREKRTLNTQNTVFISRR